MLRAGCVQMLMSVALLTPALVHAGDTKLYGYLAARSNYVFSTGTKNDSNPVAQVWLNSQFSNGVFLDLWSNAPLSDGNPERSGEIDYKIGYSHTTAIGGLSYSLAYYDIQLPDLFDDNSDFYAPEVYWYKDQYSVLATYFAGPGHRDGYRVSFGWNPKPIGQWSFNTYVNYANGPFASLQAVISKLRASYSFGNKRRWHLSAEASIPLYLEQTNDRRGRDITFSLIYDLFK